MIRIRQITIADQRDHLNRVVDGAGDETDCRSTPAQSASGTRSGVSMTRVSSVVIAADIGPFKATVRFFLAAAGLGPASSLPSTHRDGIQPTESQNYARPDGNEPPYDFGRQNINQRFVIPVRSRESEEADDRPRTS